MLWAWEPCACGGRRCWWQGCCRRRRGRAALRWGPRQGRQAVACCRGCCSCALLRWQRLGRLRGGCRSLWRSATCCRSAAAGPPLPAGSAGEQLSRSSYKVWGQAMEAEPASRGHGGLRHATLVSPAARLRHPAQQGQQAPVHGGGEVEGVGLQRARLAVQRDDVVGAARVLRRVVGTCPSPGVEGMGGDQKFTKAEKKRQRPSLPR